MKKNYIMKATGFQFSLECHKSIALTNTSSIYNNLCGLYISVCRKYSTQFRFCGVTAAKFKTTQNKGRKKEKEKKEEKKEVVI